MFLIANECVYYESQKNVFISIFFNVKILMAESGS
jgi:hypothetical protein